MTTFRPPGHNRRHRPISALIIGSLLDSVWFSAAMVWSVATKIYYIPACASSPRVVWRSMRTCISWVWNVGRLVLWGQIQTRPVEGVRTFGLHPPLQSLVCVLCRALARRDQVLRQFAQDHKKTHHTDRPVKPERAVCAHPLFQIWKR